jgi:hypothetical protein
MKSKERFTLIPTECPKFLAACLTVGIELQEGTPKISNTYSKSRKYDPDEPGDIHYYLSDEQGINPHAVAKVWLNPDPDLQEASTLSVQLIKCSNVDDWMQLSDDIGALMVNCAVGHMKHFTEAKFSIDRLLVSDQERIAAERLDSIPQMMRDSARARNGGKIAAILNDTWRPAMFAWVKAFAANYAENRDIWKLARPSIKFERDNGAFPLIIPKGKDFSKLVRRWAV